MESRHGRKPLAALCFQRMNAFDSIMARGMAAFTNVTGEPLIVDGRPCVGVVGEFFITREMAMAGNDPGYALTVVFSFAQMPMIPPVDARAVFATYQGTNPAFAAYKNKRMAVRKPSADSAGITLHLEEVR